MSAVLAERKTGETAFPPLQLDQPAPAHPVALPAANMPAAGTPDQLIALALSQNVDLDRLERLFLLKKEWEADEARKAYVAAMAEFKKNPPEILKDKNVWFKNADDSVTSYDHATIGNVAEKIIAALAVHGFSHRWTISQSTEKDAGGRITVKCILTHKGGHSEYAEESGSPDSSGKKNNIQQVASTITYFERYTLLAVTGLATKDQPDNDGRQDESDDEPSLKKTWVTKALNCTTCAELEKIVSQGLAALHAARDMPAYKAFKAIVETHGAALRATEEKK